MVILFADKARERAGGRVKLSCKTPMGRKKTEKKENTKRESFFPLSFGWRFLA